MTFQPSQIRMLRATIRSKHVKSREADDGASLHYVEGWHVIAEANRIFGFDAWDRETVNSQCVWAKNLGNRFSAAYVTRVRISVRAGDTQVAREGCGAGEATATTAGQAHEIAAKAAETDATKRALSTFGNPFGLSLYGGVVPTRRAAREGVSHHGSETEARPPAMNNIAASGTPSTNGASAPMAQSPVKSPQATQAGERSAPSARPAASTPWPEIDPFEEAATRAAERPRQVDKNALALSEPKRRRDPDHLKFVAGQPCIVCGRTPSEAHHLKFAQPAAMGRKVSDEFTVPLCALHHRELHACGDERQWWAQRALYPEATARDLWYQSRPRATYFANRNSPRTPPAETTPHPAATE